MVGFGSGVFVSIVPIVIMPPSMLVVGYGAVYGAVYGVIVKLCES